MVYVADCTYVTMRFISIKFFLRHYFFILTLIFNFLERVKGIEPLHPAWKASVLPLHYTRKTKLTLQLFKFFEWWRGKDSNLRRPKSTGLQPAPFDRFGTPPKYNGRVSTCLIKLKQQPVYIFLSYNCNIRIYGRIYEKTCKIRPK